MKQQSKTRLTVLLMILSILLLCLGLAACGETKTYKVTVTETVNGAVTLSPQTEGNMYEENAKVEVTVTPATGYEVDVFTVSTDNSAALNGGKYTLTVTADATVSATFKKTAPEPVVEKFSVTKNSPENGSIEVTPAADSDGKYIKDAEITVTLTPAQGYEVDTFTVGGADKKAELQNNVYKFNITANTAINATFKATEPVVEKYSITKNAPENGSIEVTPAADSDGKYDEGAEITVTLTPAQGYEVDTFTVGGADKKSELDSNNVYKFNITADTAINAAFKRTVIPVQSVSIDYEEDSLSLQYSETAGAKVKEATLSVKILPENATYESVEWTTEETTVVTVDGNGKVTAIGLGSDTVIVTVDGIEAWISVMVSAHEHSYGESYKSTGDSEHTATCATCDYVMTENHNTHLVSDGEEGHHTACTLCDYKTATVAHGELVVTATNSPTYHSLKCSDGCGYGVDEAHRMEVKSSSTQHWMECSVCHKVNHQENHTLKYEVTEDGQKHIAYCDSKISGTVYYCTYRSEAEDHEALEGAFTKSDDTENHYTKCKDCDTLYNPVAHSGSGFTVKDGDAEHHYRLCDDCQQAYGAAIAHSGSGFTVKEDDADHHYHLCDDCKQAYGEAIAHSGTVHVLKAGDDAHHYTQCTDCEALYGAQEHSGSGFTVKDGDADHHYRLCDGCQQAYGAAIAHSGKEHVMKQGDDDHHYTKCAGCETLFDPEEHVLSYTDKDDSVHSVACSACGKAFPDEPHEIDGAACKCGHQIGAHTLVVDEHGYTDGSCSCGKENLLFTLNSKGTALQLKEDAKEKYFAAEIKIILPTNVDGKEITETGTPLEGIANIISVIVPAQFQKVTNSAFSGCADLKTAIILAPITLLGANVFTQCTSLEWIVLPQSLTGINKNAFGTSTTYREMPSFKTVYFLGTVDEWNNNVTVTSGGKATDVMNQVQVLGYNANAGESNEWHWEIDMVLPKPWKED